MCGSLELIFFSSRSKYVFSALRFNSRDRGGPVEQAPRRASFVPFGDVSFGTILLPWVSLSGADHLPRRPGSVRSFVRLSSSSRAFLGGGGGCRRRSHGRRID